MENSERFNQKTSKPAIIAHDGRGGDKLFMINESSWAANAKDQEKRSILLDLGKLLGFKHWTDVQVNIFFNDNNRNVIVKREYCDPCQYTGEVVHFSPNETKKINN